MGKGTGAGATLQGAIILGVATVQEAIILGVATVQGNCPGGGGRRGGGTDTVSTNQLFPQY